MLVNALRGYLAEFGTIVAQGISRIRELIAILRNESSEAPLPALARRALALLVEQLVDLQPRTGLWKPNCWPGAGRTRIAGASRRLVVGATAVIRYTRAKTAAGSAWITELLAKKPARVVSVALANKTARIAWTLLPKGDVYRSPMSAAA
jgi:transposase